MPRTDHAAPTPGISRRQFLDGAARAAAACALSGWAPAFWIKSASAEATCAAPADFPDGIALYQQAFQNWAGEIKVDDVWTCAPRSPQDAVLIANWAKDHGFAVRARGMMHSWAPLTVQPGAACPNNLLLADTTQYLTSVTIDDSVSPVRVTVQTGLTMDALLAQLEQAGLGMTAVPALGDVTIGGVLAIDGHGTAVPAHGETAAFGQTYGTLSNRILSLTAVVCDAATDRYRLRTFERGDDHCGALLAHIGRAFITEVTLQVEQNQHLRCQSFTDIPASELFAAGNSGGRTFAQFLDGAGRAEAIWFPFTDKPWFKVWTVAPTKPLLSRQVDSPYNYPFSDHIPLALSNLAEEVISGHGWMTPEFGWMQYDVSVAGLQATASHDIWGWSKNTQLYVRPTTLRLTANGYAVITCRSNIQRVLSEFTAHYQSHVAEYQAVGLYPMNGPVEIRLTGLDRPQEVAIEDAATPLLSAARPRPDHPEWDVAIWFNCFTIPGTPGAEQFYRELEQWVLANYSGAYATARPEWSKGWAYTNSSAWSDPTVLGATIPDAYGAGQPAGADWDAARESLNLLDPHRVFTSPLLTHLLP